MTSEILPTIEERVTAFIHGELLDGAPDVELAPDTPLLMDGLVSSIAAIRLIVFLQDQFAIMVPPEEVTLENFGTIERISDYVLRHRG